MGATDWVAVCGAAVLRAGVGLSERKFAAGSLVIKVGVGAIVGFLVDVDDGGRSTGVRQSRLLQLLPESLLLPLILLLLLMLFGLFLLPFFFIDFFLPFFIPILLLLFSLTRASGGLYSQ